MQRRGGKVRSLHRRQADVAAAAEAGRREIDDDDDNSTKCDAVLAGAQFHPRNFPQFRATDNGARQRNYLLLSMSVDGAWPRGGGGGAGASALE